jgi:hypothetical protein
MTVSVGGAVTLDHLRARDVAALIDARGWPSISILMDTRTGDRMTGTDRARLAALVAEAERELGRHALLRAEPLVRRLHDLADETAQGGTGRGLALFVNQALAKVVRLPAPVRPRAVVEASFVTRDLLHTLHRTPPHLVLLLHTGCAHLYRGYADTLVPWRDGFPLEQTIGEVGALERGDGGTEAFLRRVDRALGRVRERHPSPLVLAGSERLVSLFRHTSRNLARLAVTVAGDGAATPADLYPRVRTGMETYLRSREQEALAVLSTARGAPSARVASGIEECWRVAVQGRPAMLVVEEGYYVPAVRGPRGPVPVTSTGGSARPEADRIHDLVDDLIETVIERGGWVAFARDGALADDRRVALVHPTPSPATGAAR